VTKEHSIERELADAPQTQQAKKSAKKTGPNFKSMLKPQSQSLRTSIVEERDENSGEKDEQSGLFVESLVKPKNLAQSFAAESQASS